MSKRKLQSIVYNADGVEFMIYQTVKPTKSGPKVCWLLEDYSTGKRRLLNNKTEKAARQRANKIRAAMVEGQASRTAISNGEWQDVCVAREIVREMGCNSLRTAAQEWADCTLRLGGKVSLLEAVQFYVRHYADGGSAP